MPKSFLTLKRSGRFATSSQLHALIERHSDTGIKQAGLDIILGEHSTTPIVTGNLRMKWELTQPAWRGSVRRVQVKNDTVYARIVDRFSRKNRGYVKRGIAKGEGSARVHLRQAVEAVIPHLWVKK